jgi:hypothetical protein
MGKGQMGTRVLMCMDLVTLGLVPYSSGSITEKGRCCWNSLLIVKVHHVFIPECGVVNRMCLLAC